MKRVVVFLTVWAMGLAGVLASVVLPAGPASAVSRGSLSAVPAVAAAPSTPGGFTSLPAMRLLDTRIGVGAAKVAVAAHGTVHLQVVGRGGVPASDVSAVVLNVTVTAPTLAGAVTVYGDGGVLPGTSNLNFVKAQTVPNLVVAPVGANGKVALYNGSAGTVQLIADVSGYFRAGAPTVAGAFGSLAPSRLLDTRMGVGAAKVAVASHGTVHLQVGGRGGVPDWGVSAVVLNVTVTAPTMAGAVTVYGTGGALPGTSNLNFVEAQTVPNLVIAPVGAGGGVDLYNSSGGTIQLIADVSGYFRAGAPTVAGAFGSLAPSRLLDTRIGVGAAKVAVAADGTVHLQVTGRGGVPVSGVSAVVLNVTVTAPTLPGAVTVYGDGGVLPGTSNLNFVKAQTVPNLVVAPVGANGKVALYNRSAGTVELIADVYGWFADIPGPVTNVTATPARTSIALSWTNPIAASLTGVMIRRAAGPTPPASPTAGDFVTNSATPATSFTDTALKAATQYSYALFAHDATPAYATAGTVTRFTTAAVPSISGIVTDAGGGHAGLVGVLVGVSPAVSGGSWSTITWTTTGGRYSVSSLPAGTYKVCFGGNGATGGSADAFGYGNQCWQNQPTWGTATPVVITVDGDTIGVNASLVGNGAISGTVTDTQGSLSGVSRFAVTATSASTGGLGQAIVNPDGSYITRGIPPANDYRVCFRSFGAQRYVEECYDNQPVSGTPNPVAVTSGVATTGIDAALSAWGTVSGTVTDAGGAHHGLANVAVTIESASTKAQGLALTDADGSYVSNPVPPASDYKVCFHASNGSGATGGSSDGTGYVDECYDNQLISGTGTPVPVPAGGTTRISAELAEGGAVTGIVTDAGGTFSGLKDVEVEVSAASTGAHLLRSTVADGSFTVRGLAAGTDYTVCFHASGATGGSSTTGYVDQCWQDQPTSGTPTPVTLTADVTTSGISASLVHAG